MCLKKKNGIPFQVLALLLSHIMLRLLHIHSIWGPNPVITLKTTLEERPQIFKKNNKNNNDTCKICYEILTTLSLNTASFVYLKGLRSTYFSLQLLLELLPLPVQDIFILLKFLSHIKKCLTMWKVEMEMTSSTYKFKMAAMKNLARTKPCCFLLADIFLFDVDFSFSWLNLVAVFPSHYKTFLFVL